MYRSQFDCRREEREDEREWTSDEQLPIVQNPFRPTTFGKTQPQLPATIRSYEREPKDKASGIGREGAADGWSSLVLVSDIPAECGKMQFVRV
jgi:hypothetical protein